MSVDRSGEMRKSGYETTLATNSLPRRRTEVLASRLNKIRIGHYSALDERVLPRNDEVVSDAPSIRLNSTGLRASAHSERMSIYRSELDALLAKLGSGVRSIVPKVRQTLVKIRIPVQVVLAHGREKCHNGRSTHFNLDGLRCHDGGHTHPDQYPCDDYGSVAVLQFANP